MTAPGFCTCKRDFPERRSFHPPIGATWHFLCDKPVLPPAEDTRELGWSPFGEALQVGIGQARERYRPTGTGWPPTAADIRAAIDAREHPPEYEPEDGEAQRIAEVFEDARAELDRGL